MPRVALMEDEVQGDQESGLHGEDGHADGDGVAPPHARFSLALTWKPGKIVRAPRP
jgi:hypothetical protein